MAAILSTTTNRFDSHQAAEYLGVSVGTLEVWRSTKRYPIPYIKVGRRIQYRKADLDAFLQSRTVGAEAA